MNTLINTAYFTFFKKYDNYFSMSVYAALDINGSINELNESVIINIINQLMKEQNE